MTVEEHIPADLAERFEIHDYRHAAAILAVEFPEEFADLCTALRQFRLGKADIVAPGGNESTIPKLVSSILRPFGWREDRMRAEMVVDGVSVRSDTHNVDYLKGRVAFDLEWNSKDQTFDRDLFAFRSFHEFNRISVGVLLTRSASLNPVFREWGVMNKYGASTTWLGKLLPRLDAGRGGGCPVLVFGITPKCIVDWNS